MDQINYQSYEKAERFDPVTRPNVLPALDRRNNRLQQAEQQFLAGLRQNARTKQINAAQSGKDLEALSQFSTSLVDYLTEKEQAAMQERIKAEDAAGEAAAYQDYISGNFTADPAYDEAAAEFDANTDTANAAGQAILDKDGNNYPAVRQIRESSGQYQMGYQRAKARIAGLEFGAYMENAMSEIDMTGMNEAEREAVVDGLRSRFMQEYGLTGLHPQFLARELYPQMIDNMSRINSTVRREAAIEDSFRVRNEAAATFVGDKNINRLLTTVAGTVDANGKKIGYQGAWDFFITQVGDQLKAGMLTMQDLKDLENQPIPGDPKGRTYGQLHKTKFTQIRKDLQAYERQEYANREQDNARQFKDLEDQLIKDFNQDPDGVTDEQIEKLQTNFIKNYGRRSDRLDEYKATLSVDSKQKLQQEKDIQLLARNYMLTPDRLKKFHPDLQSKYMSQAQQQAKMMKEKGGAIKTQMDAIETLVETTAGVTPLSKKDFTVPLKVAEMQQYFTEQLQNLTLGGVEGQEAIDTAMTRTVAKFREQVANNPVKPGTGQAYRDVLRSIPDANASAQAAQSRLRDLNESIRGGEAALDEEGGVFSKEELEKMIEGIGLPGWTPNSMLNYVAQELNVDPLTVLNRQLKAAGMNELPPSPAMEIIQNEVSPLQQQLMLQFPTPERSHRGMVSVSGPFKKELLPSNAQQFGDMIESAAGKYGIPPAIIAGLLETESAWKTTAVSPAGAEGLAQFMPATAREFGVDPYDPASAIDGAAKYLRYLMDTHGFDLNTAIKAYNGGPGGIDKSVENREYLPKVLKAAGKYGYGQQSLAEPAVMRATSPVLVYFVGETGPASTGFHSDTKRVDRKFFEVAELDEYIEVEYNGKRVPLSQTPQTSGFYDRRSGGRLHAGYDHALPENTKIYAKNGAKVTYKGDSGDGNGDVVAVYIPGMDAEIQFLHGTAP